MSVEAPLPSTERRLIEAAHFAVNTLFQSFFRSNAAAHISLEFRPKNIPLRSVNLIAKQRSVSEKALLVEVAPTFVNIQFQLYRK